MEVLIILVGVKRCFWKVVVVTLDLFLVIIMRGAGNAGIATPCLGLQTRQIHEKKMTLVLWTGLEEIN